MSERSGASGSVRSCAGSVRLGAAAAAGHEVVLDALYERKRDKKSVRVLTVLVYVFCVSLAAIMLSLYYVFFWEPKDAQYAQRKVSQTVKQQTTTTPMPTCFMLHTGGSSATVDDNEVQLPPSSVAYPNDSSEATDPTTDITEPSTLSNSTAHHNGTEDSTLSFNDTSTIVQSSITV